LGDRADGPELDQARVGDHQEASALRDTVQFLGPRGRQGFGTVPYFFHPRDPAHILVERARTLAVEEPTQRIGE